MPLAADATFDADGFGGRRKRKAKVHIGEEVARAGGSPTTAKKGPGKGGGGTKAGVGNGKKVGKGGKSKSKKKGGLLELGQGADVGFAGADLQHSGGSLGGGGGVDGFAGAL